MRNVSLSFLFFAVAAMLLLGLVSYWAPPGNAQNVLPGSKPTVEASAFPSLQAAIDAIPADEISRQVPEAFTCIQMTLVRSTIF